MSKETRTDWHIRPAAAATSRSSLDLLRLPYPFSQLGLLTAEDFATQAEFRIGRGHRRLPRIDAQVLEELHRHGVLIPLFRVDLTAGDSSHQVDLSDSLTAKHIRTTVVFELCSAAAEGRAADPASEEFQSWPTTRLRQVWPSVASGYLYSRHQLIGLDMATPFVAALTSQLSGHRLTWHLPDSERPDQPARGALLTWRSLAITLAGLGTYYWPFITRAILHGTEVWRAARLGFDPAAMLTWLGVSSKEITDQESELRLEGADRDALGAFYDIVRRAKPEAWETLRGDALAAMDLRLAADILDRFAADLRLEGREAPEDAHLELLGLSARPTSLDAALTELRLSPFPSLVIGVEGKTEYKLVPRVFELLGFEIDRTRIRIIDCGGTERDLSLLARYAGEPALGRDLGRWVELERPITRFLILTDAENKYKTRKKRNYQRELLLRSLTQYVPRELQSDYYSNKRESRIVEIRTWGPFPFEFAHFSDIELADAMLRVASMPHPNGRAGLISAIQRERATPSPNVDDVWRGSGLSKTKLADALWPLLEKKIRRAIDRRQPGPKIMRAVLRAYVMATAPYRGGLVLQKTKMRRR